MPALAGTLCLEATYTISPHSAPLACCPPEGELSAGDTEFWDGPAAKKTLDDIAQGLNLPTTVTTK